MSIFTTQAANQRNTSSPSQVPVYSSLPDYRLRLTELVREVFGESQEAQDLHNRISLLDQDPTQQQLQILQEVQTNRDIESIRQLIFAPPSDIPNATPISNSSAAAAISSANSSFLEYAFGPLPIHEFHLPRGGRRELERLLENDNNEFITLTLSPINGSETTISARKNVFYAERRENRLSWVNRGKDWKMRANGLVDFHMGNTHYTGGVKEVDRTKRPRIHGHIFHHIRSQYQGQGQDYAILTCEGSFKFTGEFQEGRRHGFGFYEEFSPSHNQFRLRFLGFWNNDLPLTGVYYDTDAATPIGYIRNGRKSQEPLFEGYDQKFYQGQTNGFEGFFPQNIPDMQQPVNVQPESEPIFEAAAEVIPPPVQINDEQVQESVERAEIGQPLSPDEEFNQLAGLLQQGRIEAEKLRGRDTVFLWGGTGSGKSLLANVLCGCTLKDMQEPGLATKFEVLGLAEGGTRDAVAVIGHEGSQTLVPQTIISEDSFSICDCPGGNDTRPGFINTANALNIKQAFQSAKSARLIILINRAELEAVRGKVFTETIESLFELFDSDAEIFLEALNNNSILIGITHINPDHTLENIRAEFRRKIPNLTKGRETIPAEQENEAQTEVVEAIVNQTFLFHPTRIGQEGCWDQQRLIHEVNQMRVIDDVKLFRAPKVKYDYLRLVNLSHEFREDAIEALSQDKFSDLAKAIGKLNAMKDVSFDIVNSDYQEVINRIRNYIEDKYNEFLIAKIRYDVDKAMEVIEVLKRFKSTFPELGIDTGRLEYDLQRSLEELEKERRMEVEEEVTTTAPPSKENTTTGGIESKASASTSEVESEEPLSSEKPIVSETASHKDSDDDYKASSPREVPRTSAANRNNDLNDERLNEEFIIAELERRLAEIFNGRFHGFESELDNLNNSKHWLIQSIRDRISRLDTERSEADRAVRDDLLSNIRNLEASFSVREQNLAADRNAAHAEAERLRREVEQIKRSQFSALVREERSRFGDRVGNILLSFNMWAQHFGELEAPGSLPPNLEAILNNSIFGPHTNDYLLFYMPQKVNNRPLTLNYFMELIHPLGGDKLVNNIEISEEVMGLYGDIASDKIGWLLLSRKTVGKEHTNRVQVQEQWELSSLLEFLVLNAFRQLSTEQERKRAPVLWERLHTLPEAGPGFRSVVFRGQEGLKDVYLHQEVRDGKPVFVINTTAVPSRTIPLKKFSNVRNAHNSYENAIRGKKPKHIRKIHLQHHKQRLAPVSVIEGHAQRGCLPPPPPPARRKAPGAPARRFNQG